ncbi:hypothetical protein [Asanoa ferruginea]|uniref:hypothetical protein n=1 Tax=Asanoa ferruginea TaxID=53367 RepID=UPI0011C13792|nr:hypothetical protein [Asanoa ferruginea]
MWRERVGHVWVGAARVGQARVGVVALVVGRLGRRAGPAADHGTARWAAAALGLVTRVALAAGGRPFVGALAYPGRFARRTSLRAAGTETWCFRRVVDPAWPAGAGWHTAGG